MADYAISGDVATLLGGEHTPGDPAALWLESSQPILAVDDEGRLGGRLRIPLATDGTFTLPGIPETIAGAAPLYRLVVDSLSLRLAGSRGGITTGWFPLTTNRDLTWIVANYVETTVITPAIAANIAAAAALGATNNTATASYVTGAGPTKTALDAAYVTAASPAFTGNPTAPTPSTADNDTSVATTAFVKAQGYAAVASPTFTGDPKAPTPAVTDNDTSLATTAFVKTATSPLIAQGVELRESFTGMADGAPPAVAATRQAMTNFQYIAAAAPYVRSGFLSTLTPGSAEAGSYRIAQLSGPVIRTGARFAFSPYTVGGGLLCLSIQAVSISTKTSGQVPVTPMHFIISPTGWSMDVNDTDNTVVEGVASGTFATPLVADSTTLHTVDVVLDRDRQKCYITLPTGRTIELSDARFALAGTYVYVEPFKSAGSLSSKTNALVKEWWADSRAVEILPVVRAVGETLPVTPTLVASWTNDGTIPVQYWRRGSKGIMAGKMSGGTTGNVIFTLPGPTATDIGFRPRKSRHFPVFANSAFGDILVLDNGGVMFVVGSNTSVEFEIEWDIALP